MDWVVITFTSIIIIAVIYLFWEKRHLKDEGVPAYNEFYKARDAYLQAQANFDQADPEHIDMAIYDLQKTEIQIGNELRKLRATKDCDPEAETYDPEFDECLWDASRIEATKSMLFHEYIARGRR